MLRIDGDGGERLSGGAKQDRIDGGLVLEGDLARQRRQGEDDVEVTWKYGTGDSSACRFASHSARPPGIWGNGGYGRSIIRTFIAWCRRRPLARRHGFAPCPSTVDPRPKLKSRNISASARLWFTRWC